MEKKPFTIEKAQMPVLIMNRHRRPRQHVRVLRTKRGRKRIIVNRGVKGRMKRKGYVLSPVNRLLNEVLYIDNVLSNPPRDLPKQRYKELAASREDMLSQLRHSRDKDARLAVERADYQAE